MAIQCPANITLYRPNANPGDTLTFDLTNDLNISDNGGLNVFFTESIVQDGDDVNGTTFFDRNVGNPVRGAGSVTNTGTEIAYTVDQAMEAGDCITLEYTADNFEGQADSDCTNTFDVCFAEDPGNNVQRDCSSGLTFRASQNGLTLSANEVQSGPFYTAFWESVTVQAASDFSQVNVTLDATERNLIFPDDLELGETYNVSYRLRDAQGNVSFLCTVTFINDVAVNAPACPAFVVIQGTQGSSNAIRISDVTNTAGATFQSVQFYDQNGAFVPGTRNLGDSRTFLVPDTLVQGRSYEVRYRIRIGDGVSAECMAEYVAFAGTQPPVPPAPGPNPPAGQNPVGINNLDCAATRWVDGTPEITCGAAATEHDAILTLPGGTPLRSTASAVAFISSGLPQGTVVTVVSTDGNGTYRFRIDASNAICAGRTTRSLGV